MEMIYLVGAEDVRHAARQMQEAADTMLRAQVTLEGVLSRHEQFLDEWLRRFEVAISSRGEEPTR